MAIVSEKLLYVAVLGNDSNPGTQTSPLRTLNGARNKIRIMKQNGDFPKTEGVTVYVNGGVYGPENLGEAVLTLEKEDSGMTGSIITYRALPGATVKLVGGVRIEQSKITRKKDSNSLITVNLNDQGIEVSQLGGITTDQRTQCTNSKSELFIDEKRAYLARWPNILEDGTYQFNKITNTLGKDVFEYDSPRVKNWEHEQDMWVHGYWGSDASENHVRIYTIDSGKYLHIDASTPPVDTPQQGARFYVLNALSELDKTNEYYIDKKTDILYLYSTGTNVSKNIWLSTSPQIININGASSVSLEGFTIMYSMEVAINAINAKDILIHQCNISHTGETGVKISGSNNIIDTNQIWDTGCAGVSVVGGDVRSLTYGKNKVTNNVITNFAVWKRTYQPGIYFGGVGNRYEKNLLKNGPNVGITGEGLLHTFNDNHLERLCTETIECSAWYAGNSWVWRESVIENNIFKYISPPKLVNPLGNNYVVGITLDNQLSKHILQNNQFLYCDIGISIGGGRRNVLKKNYFLNNRISIHIDARGMVWQQRPCNPTNGQFLHDLRKYNYQNPPFSTKFPELLNITIDFPCSPVYNRIDNNTWCCQDNTTDCDLWKLDDYPISQYREKFINVIDDNIFDCFSTK